MGILQIATVGEDTDPIMVGVREYPVSKLILIFTPEFEATARRVRGLLDPLKMEIDLVKVEGDVLLGVLRKVSEVVSDVSVRYDDIYVNVASGTRMSGCAALSAAFVNGLKAFGVENGKPMLFPVLKFSYQELISESKLSILRALAAEGGASDSLQKLSETSGVDKSLLSYHLRGGRENKGLEELGLVEIDRGTRGRLIIKLTTMGTMLLSGYAIPAEGSTRSR
ncbi:MAG: helix-turn-helix transcriptional regulator [Euryarchaeota archaeon]|nr:helix-turn-helix transcriptional regulator [Euryarchaeota archaeon]